MSSKKFIDATPSMHILMALLSQNLDWRRVLGELVDNAFDANASTVTITFGSKIFTITDNGTGCSDLGVFVRIGQREPHRTARLGHYGVGAKDAVFWIGKELPRLVVESVSQNIQRSLQWDWEAAHKGGKWGMDVDVDEQKASHGEIGTKIQISSRDIRNPPHGEQWDRLLTDLGYLYAPAIKRGKQINVARAGKVEIVKGFTLPDLESGYVHKEITLTGGRTARVHVGIVKEGTPNPKAGITYTYGFRVIIPNTDRGCGPFNIARIAGTVELLDGWRLTKNKDGISREEDDLYAAVFEACKDVLKRAETASQRLHLADLSNETERLVRHILASGQPNAKAVRGKGDEHGTKYPTGRGGKHKRAARTQPGSTFVTVDPDKLRVVFVEGDGSKAIEFKPQNTVMFFTEHPMIQRTIVERNALAQAILATTAIANYSVTISRSGKQLGLRGIVPREGEEFDELLGRLLKGSTVGNSFQSSDREEEPKEAISINRATKKSA